MDKEIPEEGEQQPPVLVPRELLSADALSGIIDEFIMREGTDYGVQELTHEAKLQRLFRQLDSGEVKIVFDPISETVTLMSKKDWIKFSRT